MKGIRMILPEKSHGVSDNQYLQEILSLEGFNSLSCKNFKGSSDETRIYPIEESVKSSWNYKNIQEIITPRFIRHLRNITGDRIIMENGSINPDFQSEKLYHFEGNYHSHYVYIKSKVDSSGVKYLEVRIIDDETRIFDNLADNKPGFVLLNNGYRSFGFDYYSEYCIISKVEPETSNSIFANIKPWKKQINKTITGDPKPILLNFVGVDEIVNAYSRLSAYGDGYDTLNSFISENFFNNLVPMSSFESSNANIPNKKEHAIAMRALRLNSILGENI